MNNVLNFFFSFVFLITLNKLYCQENEKDYYHSFLVEKDLPTKTKYFERIKDYKKYKSLEEWDKYFKNEKEKYSSTTNYIFLIDFYNIIIQSKLRNFETANELAYNLYFQSKPKVDKQYLCRLLRRMNANFLEEKKIFEMFYVNNEMLEICPEKANLSNIYSFLGQPQLAIKLLKQHRTFKKDSISYKNAQSLNDFGVFYKRNSEYDSAFHYFWKSLSMLKTIKKTNLSINKKDLEVLTGVVKGNIGEYYLHYKDYTAAKMYFFQEAKSARKYIKKGNWGFQNDFYKNMAFCYLNTDQIDLGKKYIDSIDTNTNTNNKDYYRLLATYYSKKKNLDSATYYSNKHTRYSDSINKKLTQEKNNSLLELLEYPIKLVKTEEENFNILRLNDQRKKRNQIIVLFLVIAILLIVLLYYYFVKEKRQNKLIASKNEEIKKSLTEKGVLFSELNHRVKNNLQLIISILKMQMNKLSEEEFKTTFQYSINRISTIANLHHDLLKNKTIASISLHDFIHTIIEDLKEIYDDDISVNFEIKIPKDLFIDIEQNQAIGLIVNELVTNSYKHAFEHQKNNIIKINISNYKNQIFFEFSDNGKGFKIDKVDKTKSIGLVLIQRLANQLETNAIIKNKNGVIVKFEFLNKLIS